MAARRQSQILNLDSYSVRHPGGGLSQSWNSAAVEQRDSGVELTLSVDRDRKTGKGGRIPDSRLGLKSSLPVVERKDGSDAYRDVRYDLRAAGREGRPIPLV